MPPAGKIYLLSYARVRTGGPEATQQLGRALRDLGHDACIVYIDPGSIPRREGDTLSFPAIEAPRPAAYDHYGVPWTFEMEDAVGNILVFPEMEPGITRQVRHVRCFMWWLSIDNGLRAVTAFGGFDAIRQAGFRHLAQCHYATEYLAGEGIVARPLFDYTAPEHVVAADQPPRPRVDRILYPARGRWFTGWLQRWAPDLPWQEIAGFTPAQVTDLFQTSKLYVDFGSHPGKDRMPREAALLGCCVITGQRGSAGNAFDVPIPADYKFRDSRLAIPRIVKAIRATLRDYDTRVQDFTDYRDIIRGEPVEFIAQAARIFGGRLVPEPLQPQ